MATRLKIFSLAIRNIRRKPVRSLLLFLAVIVVTGTLFSATLFISSMKNALKIGTYRLGADVLVVPEKYEAQARTALLAGEPVSLYMDSSVLDEVKKVEGVKAVSPQLFIKPSSFSCCYSVDTFLVAFDPKTDFTVAPWLKTHLGGPLTGNEIITGREVPVIAGDTIPFYGTSFTVKGTMERTGMSFFDRSVFMTMDAAYRMAAASKTKAMEPITIGRNQISAVLVKADEGFSPERLVIKIEHDVPGVKAIASDAVISTVRRQLSGLLKGILVVSAILWALALLMMGFAFYMIVNERQRELGLLMAMGAKRRHIFRLIITEAVSISTVGGAIGLVVGGALLYFFKGLILESLKLPYLLPGAQMLLELVAGAVVFSVLTGLLSSLIPAVFASRMEPYEAVRKGE
ncbi:MAG: FtsX-like permease family protein [Nitrospiraceae bacterium]|nr:FtsX-like permease family protein [Nitrospiraceae bacterium]